MTLGLRHAVTSQARETDLPISVNALGAWHRNPITGSPTFLRHSFAHNDLTWYRNINLLSIAYASQPRLRPD